MRAKKPQTRRAKLADTISAFSGSFFFIEIHAVWFVIWIVLNLIPAIRFDPYPFGLLTLIVSLEAIFLSTFVLMSQNRSAERDNERADDDLWESVLGETWSEAIGVKLGIDPDQVRNRAQQRMHEHKRHE